MPEEVRATLAERSEAKRAERRERDAAFEAWRGARPELAEAWDAARAGRLPEDLARRLCEGMEGKEDATRKHSGAVLQRLAEPVPFLIGGSADLTPSNNTAIQGAADVGPAAGEGVPPFAGRNLHSGPMRGPSSSSATTCGPRSAWPR